MRIYPLVWLPLLPLLLWSCVDQDPVGPTPASAPRPRFAAETALHTRVEALRDAGQLDAESTTGLLSEIDAVADRLEREYLVTREPGELPLGRDAITRRLRERIRGLAAAGALSPAEGEALLQSVGAFAASFGFAFVGAGEWHTCALTVEGFAYCWGDNSYGQLGTGSGSYSSVPLLVTDQITFTEIEVGGHSTCAIDSSGQAYCWGQNFRGQLGNGSTVNALVPSPVAGGIAFSGIDVGGSHACGTTPDGTSYCWGDNRHGQLGTQTAEVCGTSGQACSTTPVQVSGGFAFENISAGLMHTCAVSDGTGYCWGWNVLSQLGDGTNDDRMSPTPVAQAPSFAAIAAGAVHNCGLNASQTAYCWGNNYSRGLLGNGSLSGGYALPAPVVGGHTFSSISASNGNYIYGHSCAIAADGAAYCWGSDNDGQLGTDATTEICASNNFGEIPCSSTPIAVSGGVDFAKISAGRGYTCGVSSDGVVYCWGANDRGQLGNGTRSGSTEPAPVTVGHQIVVSVTGSPPVPGIVVTAVRTDGADGSGEYYVALTNAAGQATFSLPDGSWMIHARNLGDVGPDDSGFFLARSPIPDELQALLSTSTTEGVNHVGVLYDPSAAGGRATYLPENVERLTAFPALVLTGGTSTQQIALEFQSGATLTGQILDENGQPVQLSETENLFFVVGHRPGALLPPLPAGIPGADLPRGMLLSAATLRPDGTYTLSGAPSTEGSKTPFLLETNTVLVNGEPVVFVQPVEVTDQQAQSGGTVETPLIAEPKKAHVQYLYDASGDGGSGGDLGTLSYGWTLDGTGAVSEVFAASAPVRGEGPYLLHLRYQDPGTGQEQSIRTEVRWNGSTQQWQVSALTPRQLPVGVAVEVRGFAQGAGAALAGKLTWRLILPGIQRVEFRVEGGERGSMDRAPDRGFQQAEKPMTNGNTWLTGATE